jgi:hypothetical protein
MGGDFPAGLKSLLENATVKKVGNRVHNDVSHVSGFGVTVQNAVELGHMAHDRDVWHTRAPALDTLIRLLCQAELSKDPAVRCGNWNQRLLPEQVQYAALDAFASIRVYELLMQIVNPLEQAAPTTTDLQDGVRLQLFSESMTTCVATGVYKQTSLFKGAAVNHDTEVVVSIRATDVKKRIARLVAGRGTGGVYTQQQPECKTLGDCFDADSAVGELDPTIDVLWRRTHVRLMASSTANVSTNTPPHQTTSALTSAAAPPAVCQPCVGAAPRGPSVASTSDSASAAGAAGTSDADALPCRQCQNPGLKRRHTCPKAESARPGSAAASAAADAMSADDAMTEALEDAMPVWGVDASNLAGDDGGTTSEEDDDDNDWSCGGACCDAQVARRNGVKQDALHVMKRFEKALSQLHGCYRPFMTALRDVFFIPCLGDIEERRVIYFDSDEYYVALHFETIVCSSGS